METKKRTVVRMLTYRLTAWLFTIFWTYLFTGNLAKARADGKKQADLDGDGNMEKVRESIFALNNQWQAYKG